VEAWGAGRRLLRFRELPWALLIPVSRTGTDIYLLVIAAAAAKTPLLRISVEEGGGVLGDEGFGAHIPLFPAGHRKIRGWA
jgi:hypothetical protein